MNVQELKKRLDEINVPDDLYALLKGGLPNDAFCLVNENEEWEVYYSERGRRSAGRKFDNEHDACEYLYEKMSKYGKPVQ